ncbi:MAG: polysaccharide deacetylase family protein [Gammaproteobacteria bacterium]|nr:polysaccharide deacetylase family protein [Gammaproteobacteria bacterium]
MHFMYKPKILILMYHRILPANDRRAQLEEPGMIVTPETFRSHVSMLKQHFNIIHLSKWLELKNSGAELPERACAITFDDGWADNFEFAFPILKELDAPATVFVVSDMIGTSRQFWPERLAQIVTCIAKDHPDQWSHTALDWLKNPATRYQFTTVAPTQEELGELISNAKALSDDEIHDRLNIIEHVLNLQGQINKPDLLNWEQLSEMNTSGLIEIGSHTCNHIRLSNEVDNVVLEYEIIASKKLIEKRTGQAVKTFCFPNGNYSAGALELVRKNYVGAVSTKKGWNTAASDSCLLHRIGVHEDIARDKTAFFARLSGWM